MFVHIFFWLHLEFNVSGVRSCKTEHYTSAVEELSLLFFLPLGGSYSCF